jgi:hypothetical protein
MVLRRIRKGFDRFFLVLDSEGVGFFQTIVYVHLAIGGVYSLLVARGVPQVVSEVMGRAIEQVWLCLFLGMLVCLFGKIITADRWPIWLRTSGLWLQLAGDISALGGFAGYVLATLQTAYWGKTMIAVFGFAAYTWCALFLVVRDVRRIMQAERAVRL